MSQLWKAPITIDNTQVATAGDITDFTLLVNSTLDGTGGEPDLVNKTADANGYDIRFYADEALTTPLDQQNRYFDQATGLVISRPRIPLLDTDADQTIWMAYGDVGLDSDPSTTDAWNAAWLRRWPMHELSGTNLGDVTASNKDLTKTGEQPNPSASGQIYRSHDYDGNNDEASSTDLTGLDVATGAISFWVYVVNQNNETNNIAFMMANTTNATQSNLFINFNYRNSPNKDLIAVAGRKDGVNQWGYETPVNSLDVYEGTWLNVVIIQAGVASEIYLNGGSAQTKTDQVTTDETMWFTDIINATNTADKVSVGGWISNGATILSYNDKISDVAISTYTDPLLFSTIYNNESAPETFYTIGAEQAHGADAGAVKDLIGGGFIPFER